MSTATPRVLSTRLYFDKHNSSVGAVHTHISIINHRKDKDVPDGIVLSLLHRSKAFCRPIVSKTEEMSIA